MKRRDFILGSVAAAGAFTVIEGPKKLWSASTHQAKLARIAIMSRCFSPVLTSAAHADHRNQNLEILDLPGIIAERYGVHHVEFQHTDFASTESGYLEEFKSRMQRAKSRFRAFS